MGGNRCVLEVKGRLPMRPPLWQPPVDLSPAEQTIIKRIKRAKLFVFLRQHRHTLFDAAFQDELATISKDAPQGQPPLPPAQLALATMVQAYTGVSDDELLEATLIDRRWQLALDCLECETAPFSQGTLVTFRKLLIARQLERRLLERRVELAAATKAFGSRNLRAALSSSPLWGAGRVEDTSNLLGHALRKALGVIARQQGQGLADLASETGATLIGEVSLKAALDLDWDDPPTRETALRMVLDGLAACESWLSAHPEVVEAHGAVLTSLATAEALREQVFVRSATGCPTLRDGVARERRSSIENGQMRHGRKSRSQLIDGYKRHVLRDLESGLLLAVGVTPANLPEATLTDSISLDLHVQGLRLRELHIDRAYLSSNLVRERDEGLYISCKAWPLHNGPHFAKTVFVLDWEQHEIGCPDGVVLPFTAGANVQFPAVGCGGCAVRERCTSSTTGRTVSIHPDERLLAELRERQLTAQGRAQLRERVAVEHSLAHIGQWQGEGARDWGERKNRFDLRRTAVVHNLHIIARAPELAHAA